MGRCTLFVPGLWANANVAKPHSVWNNPEGSLASLIRLQRNALVTIVMFSESCFKGTREVKTPFPFALFDPHSSLHFFTSNPPPPNPPALLCLVFCLVAGFVFMTTPVIRRRRRAAGVNTAEVHYADCCCCVLHGSRLCLQSGVVSVPASEGDARTETHTHT